MTYHKKLKFEVAVPLKRRDNLLSSNYANVEVFIPSYQNKYVKPNLFYLMSMEYQRLWMEEKEEYLKSINVGRELKRNWLRGFALKHQSKIPWLKVPDRPDYKGTMKYAHIKSKFRNSEAMKGRDGFNRDDNHPCRETFAV